MAFVTCAQFKQSQDKQDQAVEKLQENAISAEAGLLDNSDKSNAGKITAAKIKEAIVGDIAVSIKDKSGLMGNGTEKEPLGLNLNDSLTIDEEGKLGIDGNNVSKSVGKSLAGTGLSYNDETGRLDIGSFRLVDASGTVYLGNLVNTEV